MLFFFPVAFVNMKCDQQHAQVSFVCDDNYDMTAFLLCDVCTNVTFSVIINCLFIVVVVTFSFGKQYRKYRLINSQLKANF